MQIPFLHPVFNLVQQINKLAFRTSLTRKQSNRYLPPYELLLHSSRKFVASQLSFSEEQPSCSQL